MFKKIAITLSLLLSLAACSSSETKEQPAKADMANPAAEFCAERGVYDLDSGNCTLGNGDVINAWENQTQQRPIALNKKVLTI